MRALALFLLSGAGADIMVQFGELFRQYAAALNFRDADAVADCYAERFLHVTRRGESWVHDWRRNNAEFRSQLERAGRWYKSLGAAHFAAHSVVESRLHPSHSLVRVVWEVRDVKGAEIVAFEVTFMVRVRDGQSAIVGLVAHNERRRIEEKGLWSGPVDLYFDLPNTDFDAASGLRPSQLSARNTG